MEGGLVSIRTVFSSIPPAAIRLFERDTTLDAKVQLWKPRDPLSLMALAQGGLALENFAHGSSDDRI